MGCEHFPYLLMVCEFQPECPALTRAGLYIRGHDQQLVAVLTCSRNTRGTLFVHMIRVLLAKGMCSIIFSQLVIFSTVDLTENKIDRLIGKP